MEIIKVLNLILITFRLCLAEIRWKKRISSVIPVFNFSLTRKSYLQLSIKNFSFYKRA